MEDFNRALEQAMLELILGSDGSANTSIPRYHFEPLTEPDQIRILQLHGINKGKPKCSIRQVSVSAGSYQALSYPWGSHEKPFRATVLDSDHTPLGYIPLTKRLNAALQDLWNAADLPSKVFWIDQICINQDGNEKEKNQQVAMMDRIYLNASKVITYLGPSGVEREETAGRALLAKVYKHFEPDFQVIYQARSIASARQLLVSFPVQDLPIHLKEEYYCAGYIENGWRWLVGVAFNEWIQRLWIVQEQLLNEDVVMLRGTHLLTWDAVAVLPILFDLGLLPEHYVTKYWEENQKATRQNPWENTDSVYSLWYDRRRMRSWVKLGSSAKQIPKMDRALLENILCYEELRCRDPRDHIFAILSVSCDSEKMGIIPDYSDTKSISELYRQVTVGILQTENRLRALANACRWRNLSDKNHPSWAIHVPRKPDPPILGIKGNLFQPHPKQRLASAPVFRSNNTVFVVKGQIVDRITSTATPAYMSHSMLVGMKDKETVKQTANLLHGWCNVLDKVDFTINNVASLARAIVSNPYFSPPARHKSSPEAEIVFHFWCQFNLYVSNLQISALLSMVDVSKQLFRFNKMIDRLAALLGLVPKNANALFMLGPNISPLEQQVATEFRKHQIWTGRSFSVTENGRVCSVMNEILEGDVVAALEGADCLYVLRPSENRYKLVGDAYVDGYMRGEAYTGLNPNTIDKEIQLV